MNTPVLTSADDQRTSDIDAGAHRPGIPHHEMVQKYDEWADNYDKVSTMPPPPIKYKH